MSLEVDQIVDRRRLRRKLSFWRVATFIVLAAALVGIAFTAGLKGPFSKENKAHIAQIKIEGVIVNDQPMLELIEQLHSNDQVKAVILDISSPGGSTVGGEAHYEAIRKLAEKKPVAASVGTLAASAGYMIASASDHIVARRSSIVGSIGVLFQYADVSELLDKVGVKVDAVKSAPLKAEPSPFHPASDEAIAMIDRLITDSYEWFVDLVAERRDMPESKVRALADGSVFTGSQGLDNGLIDAIGGQAEAKQWLTKNREIDDSLEIVEWTPNRPGQGVFGSSSRIVHIARYFGIELDRGAAGYLETYLKERLLLDGLVSIWQGQKN